MAAGACGQALEEVIGVFGIDPKCMLVLVLLKLICVGVGVEKVFIELKLIGGRASAPYPGW
jgi:hypothetical protein